MFTKTVFRPIKAIIPENVASTSAGAVDTVSSTDYGLNFDITLNCSTGVVYINSLTAATTTNGFRLEEGEAIDLRVSSSLSIIGNSTTAAYQAIVWEV
jgi:hypothetical protein